MDHAFGHVMGSHNLQVIWSHNTVYIKVHGYLLHLSKHTYIIIISSHKPCSIRHLVVFFLFFFYEFNMIQLYGVHSVPMPPYCEDVGSGSPPLPVTGLEGVSSHFLCVRTWTWSGDQWGPSECRNGIFVIHFKWYWLHGTFWSQNFSSDIKRTAEIHTHGTDTCSSHSTAWWSLKLRRHALLKNHTALHGFQKDC